MKKLNDRWYYAIAIFLPLAIVCVLFCTLGIGWVLYHRDYQSTAEWGDSFGFVNALFSGLAFAGVIVAIVIQTRELRQAFEEAQTSRVAYQTTAQLQHCSSIIDGVATLSKLQEKLSDPTPDASELFDADSMLLQIKIDFDHRMLLSRQIEALSGFDPLDEDPVQAFRESLSQSEKKFNRKTFADDLFDMLEDYRFFSKNVPVVEAGQDEKRVIEMIARCVRSDHSKVEGSLRKAGGASLLFDKELLLAFEEFLYSNEYPLDVDVSYLQKFARENFPPANLDICDLVSFRKYSDRILYESKCLYCRIATEFFRQCGYVKVG